MIERKIKELSIALEALSRINNARAAQAFEAVEELLGDAISRAKKEAHLLYKVPPSAPAVDDNFPF